MDKPTASKLFEELESRLVWTEEEYQQGVREAEEDGEEAPENPHPFDLRLDAIETRDGRRYRIRATFNEWSENADLRTILDAADAHGRGVSVQNGGVEIS